MEVKTEILRNELGKGSESIEELKREECTNTLKKVRQKEQIKLLREK